MRHFVLITFKVEVKLCQNSITNSCECHACSFVQNYQPT